MNEEHMLTIIHKVYPNWQPTTRNPDKRYGQICALYNRAATVLNRIPYQMSMRLYGPSKTYEQLKMEGF